MSIYSIFQSLARAASTEVTVETKLLVKSLTSYYATFTDALVSPLTVDLHPCWSRKFLYSISSLSTIVNTLAVWTEIQ